MFPNMKYSVSRQLVILFLLGAWNIQQSVSVEVADTLNLYRLKSVEVKGKKLRSPLKEMDGASVVSMSLMDDMPRILGNADPLHYAQLLPGIQTNSEYDAGIHIQGCDNSHNLVTLGGAAGLQCRSSVRLLLCVQCRAFLGHEFGEILLVGSFPQPSGRKCRHAHTHLALERGQFVDEGYTR